MHRPEIAHQSEIRAIETDPFTTLQRATVWMWADSIEEKVDFTLWLTAWKKRMRYVSPDYGGGGLHLFDVEGPTEAISALPERLVATPDRKGRSD